MHLPTTKTTPTRPRRRWRGCGDAGDYSTGYILATALAITIALAVGAILYDTLVGGAQAIDLGIDP